VRWGKALDLISHPFRLGTKLGWNLAHQKHSRCSFNLPYLPLGLNIYISQNYKGWKRPLRSSSPTASFGEMHFILCKALADKGRKYTGKITPHPVASSNNVYSTLQQSRAFRHEWFIFTEIWLSVTFCTSAISWKHAAGLLKLEKAECIPLFAKSKAYPCTHYESLGCFCSGLACGWMRIKSAVFLFTVCEQNLLPFPPDLRPAEDTLFVHISVLL